MMFAFGIQIPERSYSCIVLTVTDTLAMQYEKSVDKREENVVFERYSATGSKEDMNLLAGLMSKHATAVTFMVFKQRREDVAQEIVIKGLEAIKDFRGDSLFSTWFHAIALNHCRTKLGQEIRERILVQLDEADGPRQEADWLSRLTLAKILSQLDLEDQRFVRDKLEGRVEDEMAIKYKLSPEGVRSRWFAIKKRIRENIGGS